MSAAGLRSLYGGPLTRCSGTSRSLVNCADVGVWFTGGAPAAGSSGGHGARSPGFAAATPPWLSETRRKANLGAGCDLIRQPRQPR